VMSEVRAGWSEVAVGGHPCDLFEPATRNSHGYVLIYLHGVHLQRLTDKTEFCRQFEHHGVPVIAPMTQRSWWTDRICPEFDSELTAEQHLLRNVLPYVKERWGAKPPARWAIRDKHGGTGGVAHGLQVPTRFPGDSGDQPGD
jgi:hypothetical protein